MKLGRGKAGGKKVQVLAQHLLYGQSWERETSCSLVILSQEKYEIHCCVSVGKKEKKIFVLDGEGTHDLPHTCRKLYH